MEKITRYFPFNPLLPTGFGVKPEQFLPPFSTNTTIQLMCGTNLETSQVVLLSSVLSVLAAVLAVEIDGDKGCNLGFFDPQKGHPSVVSPPMPIAATVYHALIGQ